jgi:tetratricopeptide (TPR) repeat protein
MPHSPPPGILYEDDIDQLSNRALDAIEAKQYEEAEQLCEQLLRYFPTLIDGHDRFAMLREAQGRFREAADHYRRALELVAKAPADYAPELVTLFQQRLEQALTKSNPPP